MCHVIKVIILKTVYFCDIIIKVNIQALASVMNIYSIVCYTIQKKTFLQKKVIMLQFMKQWVN